MYVNDMMSARQVVGLLWMSWVVSWVIVARWSAPSIKTTQPGERALELPLTICGMVALVSSGSPSWGSDLMMPLYALDFDLAWTLVALVAAGFAFCCWARVHLGQMWSANITLKEEHRIIDTGPYALVRHPIYTGILLAGWATAIFHSNPLGFIGAGLLTAGFYLKARREETLLTTELGAAYQRYCLQVPMLIPVILRAGK